MAGQEILVQIGRLKDEAETPLFSARKLQQAGINRYTPGGALYLIADDARTSPILEQLTGVQAEKIKESALEEIRSSQRGVQDGFSTSEELDIMLKKALEEAGGNVNAASIEHVVTAMFTMPGAKRTDAYRVLNSLGVDENRVKENRKNAGFFKDRSKEIAQSNLAYIDTETSKVNTANVLGRLYRNPQTRMIIDGDQGSGKHQLIVSIARSIALNEYPGLKQKKMIEIDSQFLTALDHKKDFDPQKQAPDALFFTDFGKLTPDEIQAISKLSWNVPILALSSPSIDTKSFKAPWEITKISPYTVNEVSEIVQQNLRVEAGENKLEVEDLEKVAALATRYGNALFPQESLPGAAVETVKFAVTDAEIHAVKTITPDYVANVISRGNPHLSAEAMLKDEGQRMLTMEEDLHGDIVGQDEPITEVSKHLRIRASELGSERKRPIGNFVFLGPTGVGKTELAKALAKFLFDDEKNMVRLDMSEYQERHTVARLIGAPPGYVGYEEGGQLTEAVRQRPFSVVMFDEIDKAHPEVLNALLQIMDDGRLTDGKGRTVDFSQTVVIMTSNNFAEFIYNAIAEGRDMKGVKQEVKDGFVRIMRPEFINRIDSIIVFDPISKDQADDILEMQLEKEVIKPLAEKHNAKITFDESSINKLVDLGFDPKLGGRPLLRAINNHVKDPLSIMVLSGQVPEKSQLLCTVEEVNGEEKVVLKNLSS